MLRPPHKKYSRLYTYHFDGLSMPSVDNPDLIGIWEEGETTIYFFHSDQKEKMRELEKKTGAAIVYEADVDYKDWEAGQKIGRAHV